MGNQNSSNKSVEKAIKDKVNRNHHRTKSFRIGLSFGKGMSSVEGHAQIGYASHTKKRYGKNAFEKSLNNYTTETENVENENKKNLINKKQQPP